MAAQLKKISSIILLFSLLSNQLQFTTTTKVVEDDMLLTDEQHELLYSSDDDSMRNGLVNIKYRWPNGVMPYVIDFFAYDDEQKIFIREVIKTINAVSCVNIRPMEPRDKHWITITDGNRGCQSAVGYRGRPDQYVYLRATAVGTGCLRFGSIAHELLHSLGFYHTHSSTNRDDSIRINWNNIREGRSHNFKKYGSSIITDFGYPYDYDSVLHYSSEAFSKNGKPTITPKRKTNTKLGQRTHISKIDIKKLNTMYQCKKK